MLSSRSGIVIASAAVIGYSTYLLARRLSPSLGRVDVSENLSNSREGENDSTLASFNGPIFRKAPDANEAAIYKILGSHPRIVKYLGSNPLDGCIMLPFLRNGGLLSHLVSHPDVPLATRLTWALEIVQGVAHLHARDVIWGDPHLQNVLLTDDHHAVLCDFGLSVHKAPYRYTFTTGPPMTYLCPIGYCAHTPRRTDIFGLGVILFVLLSERFPFHKDLMPSPLEEIAVMQKHDDISSGGGVFDQLPPSLHSYFGSIVAKCFTIAYESADTLATELEVAISLWWKDNEQNLVTPDSMTVDTPYPQRPVHLPIEQVQHQYLLSELDFSNDTRFQYPLSEESEPDFSNDTSYLPVYPE